MILLAALLAVPAAPHDPRCDSMQTRDLMACAGDAYRRADAALNVQWKATITKMKAWEKAIGTPSPEDRAANGNLSYAQSLLASQRAWLAYRDAQCRLRVWANAGGHELPIYRAACLTRLTEARTQELKDFTEGQ